MSKSNFYHAAQDILADKKEWHIFYSQEREFIERGGIAYPYDTISANIGPIFSLLEESGQIKEFEEGRWKTVCDIGCANGDLSFAFERCGFSVTAVDYSYGQDQAPFVVSSIARNLKSEVAVVDMSVDKEFTLDDLRSKCIYDPNRIMRDIVLFDLTICVGLLYHLKNPFAFLESLRNVSKYVILGTHIVTHLPDVGSRISDHPLAYLVDTGQLNNDPTNYWMFTELAFHRMIRRCGFKILSSIIVSNNELKIATPDNVHLGIRCFTLLTPV